MNDISKKKTCAHYACDSNKMNGSVTAARADGCWATSVFYLFIYLFSYINDPECLYLRRRVKWLLPLQRVGREPGPLLGIYVKPQSFSPHLTACLRAPERQRNVKSFSRAQGSSLSSASLAYTHTGGLDEDCCPLKARAGTFFFFLHQT